MEKKTYLVTGASGFIGRSLVERLRANGHVVRCAMRRVMDCANDVECPLGASIDTWLNAIDGVDGVFHLAWSTVPRTANGAPLDDVATNVIGTVALLEAMRRHPGVPFVFASSGGTVYGVPEADRVSESHPLRPLGVYGASKAAVEGYAMLYRRQFNVDARILRVSNPFGPGQNVEGQLGAASIFAWRALAGLDIQIWGDGSVVRDYLYI
ncbi:NAD-dependent epimerase/dehydratase family protein, partial [[Kitasatospora] papulosa]